MSETLTVSTPRQSRIRELIVEAHDKAEKAKEAAADAVSVAAECGKLLAIEKEQFRLALPSGSGAPRPAWSQYYEAHFGTALPFKTAEAWQQLSLGLDDTPPQTDHAIAPNVMRKGMSTLVIYPAKDYSQAPGDVPIRARPSHLSIVNRFVAWAKDYRQRYQNKITPAKADELRADLAPIVEFLRWLDETR